MTSEFCKKCFHLLTSRHHTRVCLTPKPRNAAFEWTDSRRAEVERVRESTLGLGITDRLEVAYAAGYAAGVLKGTET